MEQQKSTPNPDQERIEALRLALRGWRPVQASRPWEREEHRDRRIPPVPPKRAA